MKKWVLSALVYLIAVLDSYYAFTAMTSPTAVDVQHSNNEQHHE